MNVADAIETKLKEQKNDRKIAEYFYKKYKHG